jgi:membrane protein implicated in regulation of membrane protease activity
VRTLARYLVFQLPAWLIASGVALAADAWTSLPHTWIVGALALYVAKDFALFPFVRASYEPNDHEPGHDLLGASARVVVPLVPDGWVEVRHERWRARPRQSGTTFPAGAHVRVRALDGLVVLVEAED